MRAEHRRLTWAVYVGVKHTHASAFVRERKREIRCNRRLADAALARTHRDDVLHAREYAQRALHLMRNDVLRHLHLHGRGAQFGHGIPNGFAHGLCTKLGGIAERDANDNAALRVGFNILEHARRNIIRPGHGVDQLSKSSLDFFGGNGHLIFFLFIGR